MQHSVNKIRSFTFEFKFIADEVFFPGYVFLDFREFLVVFNDLHDNKTVEYLTL